MKVILLKNVQKIGKKYEVVDVSSGHASNFLIPRGLAEVANASNIKKIESLRSKEEAEMKVKEDLLLKNLEDLKGLTVRVQEVANEQGHLFAGIHPEEMVAPIKEQTRLDILPEHIILTKPIKTLGEHKVTVSVQGVSVEFTLLVEAK